VSKIPNLTKRDVLQRLWKFEAVGFLLVIATCWITEIYDPPFSYSQVVFETAVILLVAAFVISTTNKLVSQIKYLEGLTYICAWCKQVRLEGEWVPVETVLHSTLKLSLSHGICPDCLKRETNKLKLK
jgi:hypothetical protein